jgi:hypothetical protein
VSTIGFRIALLELLFYRQFPKVSILLARALPNEVAEGHAQKKYSEFVLAGIDNPSIWDYVETQRACGSRRFAEGLQHL